MKNALNYAGYLDRYLDGNMTKEEKTWFEKELTGNAELQTELDLYKQINRAVCDKEAISFKDQLNDIHDALYEAAPVYRTKRLRNVAITFGVAATVAIGVFTLPIESGSSVDNLVSKYYSPYESNNNFRSSTSEYVMELKDAMSYYEAGDYELAIEKFENILATNSDRIGLQLYSGISHMEIQQYKEANDRFTKVIDHKENAFVESAQWYLGFCYLLTNETEGAKKLFTELASSEGFYQKDAKKILKKL